MKKSFYSAVGIIALMTSMNNAEASTWSSGNSEALTGNARVNCSAGVCSLTATDLGNSITEQVVVSSPAGVDDFIFDSAVSEISAEQEFTIPEWTEEVTEIDPWNRQEIINFAWTEEVTELDPWDRQELMNSAWTEEVTEFDSWDRQELENAAWEEEVTEWDSWTRQELLNPAWTEEVTEWDMWDRQEDDGMGGFLYYIDHPDEYSYYIDHPDEYRYYIDHPDEYVYYVDHPDEFAYYIDHPEEYVTNEHGGSLTFDRFNGRSISIQSDINNVDASSGNALLLDSVTLSQGVEVLSDLSAPEEVIYIRDSNIGGDLSVSGTLTSSNGIGLLVSDTDITGNIDLSGTINAEGAEFARGSAGSFTSSADITSANSLGISLSEFDITNSVNISGTINSENDAVNISNSSLDSFVSTADIVSNNDGIMFYETTGINTIDISGTIDSYDTGVAVRSGSIGTIDISADITSQNRYGVSLIYMDDVDALNVSGTIESTHNAINLYSMRLDSLDISSDITSTSGYGVYFGQVRNSSFEYSTDLNNTGSINSDSDTAIYYYGNENNTLNYSGNGSLSGVGYDIDMNGGNDTFNVINANIEFPSLNNVETVSVASSTLRISLDDVNKSSTLIDTNGVASLTLSDVTFDVTSTATLSNGDQLTFFDVDTINITDLSSLSINLDGDFSIYDNGGIDQLIFTYDLADTGGDDDDDDRKLAKDQPASAAPAAPASVALASVGSAMGATQATNSVVSNRISSTRKVAAMEKGVELALNFAIQSDVNFLFDMPEEAKHGLWLQTFGQNDEYDGTVAGGGLDSSGYESSSYGITVGYDYKISNEFLAGVALTHTIGDVEGSGDSFESDMNSTQLNLYGSYTVDDMFFDAIVGYGIGNYDQKRVVGVGDIAESDYDSSQISTQINVGQVFFATDDLLITPFAKAAYMNIDQDSYDESGSSSDLSVDSVSIESLQIGAGFEMSYVLDIDEGTTLLPRFNFEYSKEMGDDSVAINTNLLGSGLSGGVITTPDMGSDIIRTGLGLTYMSYNNHMLSLDYTNETRDNYKSNGIFLKAKYMF